MMLSNTEKTKLRQTVKKLSDMERKLVALKSICIDTHYHYGYGYEPDFLTKLMKAGAADSEGKIITAPLFKKCVANLHKLGLSTHHYQLKVPDSLRHEILILMTEAEMAWVFALVPVLSGKDIPEFTEIHNLSHHHAGNSGTIQTHLAKAIYSNEPEYFLLHSNNPIYCNNLLFYVGKIFSDTSINMEWLQSRDKIIQWFIYTVLLRNYYCDVNADNTASLAAFCQQDFTDLNQDCLHYYSAIIYLSLGNTAKASTHGACMNDASSGLSLAIQASLALFDGESALATALYRKALTELRKQYDARTYYFDTVLGIFHSLSQAYGSNNLQQLNTNETNYRRYSNNNFAMPMETPYTLLPLLVFIENGQHKIVAKMLQTFSKELNDEIIHPMALALYHLIKHLIDETHLQKNLNIIHAITQQCVKTKQLLAAHIFYELLHKTTPYQDEATAFFNKSTIKWRVLDLIKVKEAWEYSFQALEGMLLDNNALTSTPKTKRLLWLVDPDDQTVQVVEQTLNKSGSWSSGQSISLNKLKNHRQYPQLDHLSNEDHRVIDCIIESNDWSNHYVLDPQRTLLALVGHKHIAHQLNKAIAIELVMGEPELYIEENKKGYKLSLSHWSKEATLIMEPESINKYRVIEISAAFANIGTILTKNGLTIPAAAKDKLVHVIQNAKRDIKIHVGINDIEIPEIAGDPTTCIQLLPLKEGIKANLWVRPVANQGTYCKPGQGKEQIMMLLTNDSHETRTRVVRDFAIEKNNKNALLLQCPNLAHHEYEPGDYETDTPEDTLEVLSELQRYAAAHSLNIEWPQGQTFKIKQQVLTKSLTLRISSETNWFEYQGELTLDDGEIINMQALLESINTQSFGRFVRLDNGEFIELTSQLRKQLSLLHAISDGNKINPLGAQILSDIAAEAENTSFDEGWEAHLKKMQTMKKHKPKVPSTLQASLRDYQTEGFHYLSRLTHWGIGACLADDMGLGKTVQTIALLLERAKNGPSLVIAPTSVCFNWVEELNKFAPTLQVRDLRTDERATLINKAGKFDVIICSYGLLQHNADLLTGKQWETIVLDEAQAIKNANTQRWKSVMKLKGKSRIALSGTPIENHLGELWSIFSFINPGLLGSIKSFQNKYSTPIENQQSQAKTQALKTLVSPYILRRLKSEVLSELPPKTEQTIHVEQTIEEAAFYETLRRKAEERMTHLMEENNRIGVLAEITKLRQACCDSSLVDSSLSIENSKLNAFIETLKNIIDNGHKALVFSQYVSFLQIVKKRIEEEKIVYQYLDGSTSPANRKKSVDAFQSGEGDVFLLSLKAGGSGLNLTAADYVIHLDPWWNPAVEDQASDRAHRIGQERPVTIYRFIMQNTIEEKIIALHQQKRNLANDLLSGQGVGGKLSNDDLMNLIVSSNMIKE